MTTEESSENLEALRTVERLDPRTCRWEGVAPMLHARRHACAVAACGLVFAIGGHDGLEPLKTVERFNANAGFWEEQPSLQEPRFSACAAALGGFLYVMGGHDGKYTLASAERLDVAVPRQSTSRWEALPFMQEPRMLAAAIVHGRRLFVVGGTSSGSCAHRTTEWLDLEAQTWRLETSPTQVTPRLGAAVARVGGTLVAAGGYADVDSTFRALASAEGLGANGSFTWAALPALHVPRLRATAAAADGNVYVLGGSSGGTALASVEMWNRQMTSWEVLQPMTSQRDALAAVAARF